MLDLSKYQSIGEALRDALIQYSNEVCLIEADREREKERLTYRDFKERAHPLSKALQDGGFSAGARASIIMTNQSKWLISAYAIFFAGGVLVPLDYKLTPDVHCLLVRDGRPPKGLHDDPRKLSGAVRRAHIDLSVLAGRALPQYPSNKPCHRFHGWFFRTVYVRRSGRAFAHVAS